MIQNIILVALGGAVGSVGRYLIGRLLGGAAFPWGTLTVNIAGCLLIGLLTGLVARETLSPEMKLLLVTGCCGGFTTFSTFAGESLAMMRAGDVLLSALYVAASIVVGILAVYAGQLLGKAM